MTNKVKIQSNDTKKSRGFSLIELLISLLLGGFVMASVVNLFVSNKLAFNLQSGVLSLQEEGRQAIERLNVSFADAGFSEDGRLNEAVLITGDTVSSSTNTPYDKAVIQVDGGLDCANREINNIGWKRFYVDANENLICTDSVNNTEILAEQVEAFKIQYGVTSQSPDDVQVPQQYVALPVAGQTVLTIRFALLMRSGNIVTASNGPRDERAVGETINLLGYPIVNGAAANQVNLNDGFLHRVFMSTIRIRNFNS